MLARLRAHYPEHQQKEEKTKQNKTRQDKTRYAPPYCDSSAQTTHPAFPPHANHHRYSAITQPCHKTHSTNQQYCDSKHKTKKNSGTQFHTKQPHPYSHHTPPPHFPTHNTRENKTKQEEDPIRTQGHHNTHPAIQQGLPSKRDGGCRYQQEGTPTHNEGVNATIPALHLPCHPPPQHTPHHP